MPKKPKLKTFQTRLFKTGTTLKRLLFISLGLGVFSVGLVTANITRQNSLQDSEVLGARENPGQALTSTPAEVEAPVTAQADYRLQGAACSNNRSGTTCELFFENSSVLTLKDCTGEGNPQCSFYSYSLGRTTETGIYIFQSYQAEDATLTDVLEYSSTEGRTTNLETVLLEDTTAYRPATTFDLEINSDNLLGEVERNNAEYVETLDKYR